MINNKIMLKNKTAIITGSGQGIGKGIALELARDQYNVVITDINEKMAVNSAEEIAKKTKAQTLAVKCDVSKKEEVEELISKTVKKFKRIDVLVNNAGIFPYKAFGEMQESDWDKVMDVNLKSMFLCSSLALKKMKSGAKIINISSIASIVGFESLVHYCASKGGTNGFTRSLALELAPKKINVNAVAPGAIKTPGASKGLTKESIKQITSTIPLAKFGTPEDIAYAVAFLASDMANYITGQVIVVDGGWTLK
jgi:3-oxoacyl-[acyl-carrier protein] reductase